MELMTYHKPYQQLQFPVYKMWLKISILILLIKQNLLGRTCSTAHDTEPDNGYLGGRSELMNSGLHSMASLKLVLNVS